jgi:hypothetical protein
MDHRHPGVQHNETALNVDAERGRRIAATLDTNLVEFTGESFRGLRTSTGYKDRPAGPLVGARDTLKRSALPRPRLTDHDNEPPIGARHPDRSLLLTRKLTTTRLNPSRKQLNLGSDEHVVDRLAANRRKLADAPQRLALKRAMHSGRLPTIDKIKNPALLVQSCERSQPRLRSELRGGLECDSARLA